MLSISDNLHGTLWLKIVFWDLKCFKGWILSKRYTDRLSTITAEVVIIDGQTLKGLIFNKKSSQTNCALNSKTVLSHTSVQDAQIQMRQTFVHHQIVNEKFNALARDHVRRQIETI